jgi:hypothetical protein
MADPEVVDYDPEPCDIEDLIVDWDQLDSQRSFASPDPSRYPRQRTLCHA